MLSVRSRGKGVHRIRRWLRALLVLTIPSPNHSPHDTNKKKICHHLCSCSLVFVCICYTISWARSLVLHPLKVKAWLCKYSPKGSCLCVLLCPWLCCSQVDYKCWKFQFCGLNLCGSFCWLFGTFAAWVWTDLSQVLARLLLNFRGFVCAFSCWNCRLCCDFVVHIGCRLSCCCFGWALGCWACCVMLLVLESRALASGKGEKCASVRELWVNTQSERVWVLVS